MPYEMKKGMMYRMPTHFGPSAGPRQGPDGGRFACSDGPKTLAVSLSFLGDAIQLEALLPHGFSLSGEPLVTVTALYQREIEWLAGRGYNILGVRIPATFQGERDRVTGTFLPVLWENLADPIITGREELGFAKVYGELPAPEIRGEFVKLHASWLGFRFLDMQVECPHAQDEEEIAANAEARSAGGDLHYKYVPRTGEWGTSDAEYVTYSPNAPSNQRIQERHTGSGTLEFHEARWQDMPTQYNIVNALAGLTVREYRGASVTRSVGSKDLKDTRILS